MTQHLIFLSIILLIISSCGQNSFDRKAKSSDTVSSDTAIGLPNVINLQDNLIIAREFAENFLPDTTMQDGLKKMNNFPDNVVRAFKALRFDRVNQEKYLTLVYLKIYRGHLQCCHQSYELRVNLNSIGIDSITDPLLFEYNLITNQFDNNKRIERISSGIADSWVNKNKKLLSYDKIEGEYKIIKTIQRNIENIVIQ